jgi:hypothetical protein
VGCLISEPMGSPSSIGNNSFSEGLYKYYSSQIGAGSGGQRSCRG